eukprot:ctg_1268.g250
MSASCRRPDVDEVRGVLGDGGPF